MVEMNPAWLIVSVLAALIIYILVGYPVILGVLSRCRARPHRRGEITPTVSVIIPAYNGEGYLSAKLDSILALEYPPDHLQILVVSDGSTDRTDAIAREYGSRGVELLRVERGGKPAALNAAIPQATGEILLLTDVRQYLEPKSLRRLVSAFADPEVGVASGELIIRNARSGAEAEIGLYRRFETWMRDQLSRLDSMFGATGAFYAMRRDLAVAIPPDMLLDDVYLPLTAYFRGYRLVMENQARAYDIPTSRDTEFARKVRTLAGNFQILREFPALLGPGNRMWFHFVSYKLARLLLPWLLLALALSSLLVEAWARPWLLAPQLGCYFLAVADGWIPAGNPLKKVSSPLRTFVVMMIAAMLAVQVFFVSPRSLWKVTSASSPTADQLSPNARNKNG